MRTILVLILVCMCSFSLVAAEDKVEAKYGNPIFRIGQEIKQKYGERFEARLLNIDKLMDPSSPYSIGGLNSFVPHLGKVIWELPSDEQKRFNIVARTYQTENDINIGYLRIPRYDYNQETINKIEKIISIFEETADHLVFDQVNNPGGSVFQMYAVLSCLTPRPLQVLPHQFKFDESDKTSAEEVLFDAKFGVSVTAETLSYSKFVLEQLRLRPDRASELGYIGGIKYIHPAKIHYTKKLYVLINELTFSSAEFLAAILRDNNRAVIFGTTSAGAGGCARFEKLPRYGMVFSYTWTIARRLNGTYIENYGVQPDIIYKTTVEDIQSKYQGYQSELLKIISIISL